MPFSFSDAHHLRNNIRNMYARLDMVSTISLTQEEFLRLFVPADQRDLFRQAAVTTRTVASRSTYPWAANGEVTDLMFYIHDRAPLVPIPAPRTLELQPDSEDIQAKISQWLTNGVHASRDFGRVAKVFDKLNDDLSVHAIRFYWPAIMTIAAEDEETAPILNRLKEMKGVTKQALPFGMAAAVRKAAETVTATSLLAKDMTAPPTQEVTLRVERGQEYSEPGIGKFVGLQ